MPMERSRRKENVVLMFDMRSIKGFCQEYALELKLIVLFILIGILLLTFLPSFGLLKDLNGAQFFQTALKNPSLLNEQEQVDVSEMVEKTMSYSYEETELGFYLKNLTFFDTHSKLEAEKKILTNLPTYLAKRAKKYLRAVLLISEQHQVDPIWVLSVMWTESHFDYSAKSWAGARGLMQIMPDTRKFIYRVYKSSGNKLLVEQDTFNIDEYFPYKVTAGARKTHILKLANIELGVIYLKKLLQSFKSHKYATVAYNMGPGWTRGRLRRKLPVGQKNKYLDKVRKAYKYISQKI